MSSRIQSVTSIQPGETRASVAQAAGLLLGAGAPCRYAGTIVRIENRLASPHYRVAKAKRVLTRAQAQVGWPDRRVSYNGITSASQADDDGSIPFTRSINRPAFIQKRRYASGHNCNLCVVSGVCESIECNRNTMKRNDLRHHRCHVYMAFGNCA